ncbi:TetR/AcrR family transcriptional regulator [Brevibacterium metallidurans]|uniref:HTH tetR-type domain-containing protein n=1 Tax=Brevibacterium metallidurans TaxID=1482676 RepID=A0ABP3C9H0_9MICO
MAAAEETVPEEGLRERKKREREQALRRAALDLTAENGFANVTIEAICDRAGVSRRTFFNYFGNKEEALLGRSDTVFDDEDRPAIAEFEAGGPSGRLLTDLEGLLTVVIRSRLRRREEMHRFHQILKQEPALMQLQMSRMGSNERLFREMIHRRLEGGPPVDGSAPVDGVAPDDGATPAGHARETDTTDDATASAGEVGNCLGDEGPPVSPRAEAVAALAMMAIRTTFMRLRRDEGDPDPVIREIFAELRAVFAEDERSAD